MRKLVAILMFVVVAMTASAQLGKVSTIAADTVNGNETIYLATSELNIGYDVTIQALCSNIGGTSDGTITVEGSLDGTSYKALTSYSRLLSSESNDSLTITDAAVGIWTVEKSPFKYLRLAVAGTASDSTLITPKYNQVEPYR